MTYPSYLYLLLFLPVTFLLYTLLPRRWKFVPLLLSSYLFFYYASHGRLLCLVFTTLSVYGGALLLSLVQQRWDARRKTLQGAEKRREKARTARKKRAILALILLLNFGVLALFKYHTFFAGLLKGLLGDAVGSSLADRLLMPLGISFYTLQAVGYLLDVYRGKIAADRNLCRVALFLSFFPQITEGPIGRYDRLAGPLYEGHPFDYRQFTFGLQRIVWGLFKKLVIADRASVLVSAVFSDPASYQGVPVLMASLFYTLQIYMEFSGVMDLVIGSAQLFSIPMSENFSRPFFSKTVSEFWRRWHITLGSFLRDYLLFPISLSGPMQRLTHTLRKHASPFWVRLLPTAVSLLFVWLGMGVWHGVGWHYVLYGLYYYLIMVLGMLSEPLFARLCPALHCSRQGRLYGVFQILRTCLLVNFGMLLFRASSTAQALSMFASIFRGFTLRTFADGTLLTLGCDGKDLAVLLLGTLVVFAADLRQEHGHALRTELAATPLRFAVYLCGVLAVVILGAYGKGYGTVDLIYAQF